MIANWKVSAHMTSPICGDPPMLDAVLAWELAARLGFVGGGEKITRGTSVSTMRTVPIPVSRRTMCGVDVACCSSPILAGMRSEWVEHNNKRIDTHVIAEMLAPESRKSLLVASGPYKMRHVPKRIRLVERVVWFVRGDRQEMRKLLKNVHGLGHKRNIGYGWVSGWTFEDMGGDDFSLFARRGDGEAVLMRPIPAGAGMPGLSGATRSFGAIQYPYWHPDNFTDCLVPC